MSYIDVRSVLNIFSLIASLIFELHPRSFFLNLLEFETIIRLPCFKINAMSLSQNAFVCCEI